MLISFINISFVLYDHLNVESNYFLFTCLNCFRKSFIKIMKMFSFQCSI